MDPLEADKPDGVLRVPSWLVVFCGMLFAAWLLASIVVLNKTQYAIAHTTFMCTDRLIAEMDVRTALRDEAETLRKQNRWLTGRVDAFELVLNVSRGCPDTGVGGTR